jgi:hypothetical protein
VVACAVKEYQTSGPLPVAGKQKPRVSADTVAAEVVKAVAGEHQFTTLGRGIALAHSSLDGCAFPTDTPKHVMYKAMESRKRKVCLTGAGKTDAIRNKSVAREERISSQDFSIVNL